MGGRGRDISGKGERVDNGGGVKYGERQEKGSENQENEWNSAADGGEVWGKSPRKAQRPGMEKASKN